MAVQFEVVCGPKVHDILGRCRRPLVVVNALDRLSISSFVLKIYRRPLKLPLSCEVGPKKVFFAPDFDLYGEGIHQILDMRFQIAVISEHLADFG